MKAIWDSGFATSFYIGLHTSDPLKDLEDAKKKMMDTEVSPTAFRGITSRSVFVDETYTEKAETRLNNAGKPKRPKQPEPFYVAKTKRKRR